MRQVTALFRHGETASEAVKALVEANVALQDATAVGGGSFIGAYQGLGWWRIEADIPARWIDDGAVLVGVAVPDGRCDEAQTLLKEIGADLVDAV